MIFQLAAPSPALSPYVRHYQLIHFVFAGGAPRPVKPYPPRPEQCLIFYPRDPLTIEYLATGQKIRQPRSIVSGQVVSRQNLHIGDDYIVLKVVFYPGALFHLVQLPLTEITDSNVDAESVFGPQMRQLNERLGSTSELPAMVALVEAFLLRRLRMTQNAAGPLDQVARLLLYRPEAFSLDYLAAESCLSPRQFQRRFSQQVGVSPKWFSRISRFDRAFRLKCSHPGLDWLQVAVQTGYQDYQHLAKEFAEFAGVRPNVLVREESSSPDRYFGFRE
jgi:AraC-like DNA-binding protein